MEKYREISSSEIPVFRDGTVLIQKFGDNNRTRMNTSSDTHQPLISRNSTKKKVIMDLFFACNLIKKAFTLVGPGRKRTS